MPWAGVLAVAAIVAGAAACSGRSGFSSATVAPASPGSSGSTATATAITGTSDADIVNALKQAAKDLPLNLAQGTKLGKDNAPLKLETFVDFQCPYCLRFTATQEPTLISEYVKTGKLQIIVRPFPIFPGDESVRAAVAAECAAQQNSFWPYYEQLYLIEAEAGQASHEQTNVGRFSQANLMKVATDLKLDTAAFSSCLGGNAALSAVQDSVRAGRQYGISSTPGFAVNGGHVFSGVPNSIDFWRNLLNGMLSGTPFGGA